MFRAIARFVASGSFLIIRGEDDNCLRYLFKNGRLRVDELDHDLVDGDDAEENT